LTLRQAYSNWPQLSPADIKSLEPQETKSGSDDVEAGKARAEALGVTRQQGPALDSRMGTDEEVWEHLGSGAGVGMSRKVSCIVAIVRFSNSMVENDTDSSA